MMPFTPESSEREFCKSEEGGAACPGWMLGEGPSQAIQSYSYMGWVCVQLWGKRELNNRWMRSMHWSFLREWTPGVLSQALWGWKDRDRRNSRTLWARELTKATAGLSVSQLKIPKPRLQERICKLGWLWSSPVSKKEPWKPKGKKGSAEFVTLRTKKTFLNRGASTSPGTHILSQHSLSHTQLGEEKDTLLSSNTASYGGTAVPKRRDPAP